MTRPSRNTDKLLIDAAKKLIPKTGISGLRVRDVARSAGVNLGMFNYHFGTKDKFIEVLLAETYDEFFNGFKLNSDTGATPLERFRNAITSIAFFIREHRTLLLPLVEEILSGNRHIMHFVSKNMTKHVAIIFRLLNECQKANQIVKAPIPNLLPTILGSIAGPIFAIKMIGKFQRFGLLEKGLQHLVETTTLSDKAVCLRIELVMKALEV